MPLELPSYLNYTSVRISYMVCECLQVDSLQTREKVATADEIEGGCYSASRELEHIGQSVRKY